MATKTQEKILGFLQGAPEEQITIRGISKKLNKSYTLVYNNIADLEKKGIISKKSVPPAQIISISEFAPMEILVEIELKRKDEFQKKFPWIKLMIQDALLNIKNVFFVALAFGSYAKGTQTQKSDIDLMIIVNDRKEIYNIEEAFNKVYTKTKKSVHCVSADDFKNMIKKSNEFNIGNEAKKSHILLYGAEQYYKLLKME